MDADSAEAERFLRSGTEDYERSPQKHRAWATIRSNWWIVQTSLLLLTIALLVEQRWHQHKQEDTYELTGDLTGFAPHFPQEIVKLKPDLGFVPENTSEFWSDAVQNKWLSIVPRGLGYVRIEEPAAYSDLPTPLHDYPDNTVFTTSVVHQLHCLYNILAVYSAITGDNPNGIPTAMTWHLQHCFEYLRLNIMCCGDVALEGAETTFPNGFDGSDGWDSQHICKDYGQVYDHMDRNRANDTLWI